MKPRYWFYGVVSLVLIVMACLLIKETTAANGEIWHFSPFLGGVLVTVGWVVTSELGIRNSKTQHTISLITQQAFDKHRLENREIVKKHLPSFKSKLTREMADFDDENHELLKAIDQELNFFEFIAAAVHRDTLDEKLLLLTLRGRFCRYYEQNADYIAYWRKQGNTWKQIEDLYKRWSC